LFERVHGFHDTGAVPTGSGYPRARP
jgi:hypothetical protein